MILGFSPPNQNPNQKPSRAAQSRTRNLLLAPRGPEPSLRRAIRNVPECPRLESFGIGCVGGGVPLQRVREEEKTQKRVRAEEFAARGEKQKPFLPRSPPWRPRRAKRSLQYAAIARAVDESVPP